eukprot:CAMPEP_0170804276 /NCGR_PEP_ID=MMETSP0733-20121128/30598_1 /TAXON_ID=186038 /ORGANISM="Fragilariopsis kerguelensis, Strain L26-C5" /LENGTH=84 /DNA_ID=CAMNT_0011158275 /DNA_START=553 /DNA_END=805 /DNA_ORIENTATION=-
MKESTAITAKKDNGKALSTIATASAIGLIAPPPSPLRADDFFDPLTTGTILFIAALAAYRKLKADILGFNAIASKDIIPRNAVG